MNNFKDKLNDFFFLGDEESPQGLEVVDQKKVEPQQPTQPAAVPPIQRKEERQPLAENRIRRTSGGENVVPINQKQAMQKPQISIIEPRLYSEVQEVADYILENQTVIVNFRRMDHEQATKMIDFLMGVTYALKGDIQRLEDEIFICTPQSVTVHGSELSEYTDLLM